MATFCLDISTAPLHNAGEFILPGHPPANYKKPEAIADWQAADVAEKLAKAALDPDLCRITGASSFDTAPGAWSQFATYRDEH